MSAEATTTTITTEAPTALSPEAQSAALTIESAQDLLRSVILERFASIGADAVVVEITQDGNSTRYSAKIGSGPYPWFREEGTVTINGAEVAHKPEKYFGRQIFTYRPTNETQNPYPIYANDKFAEIDPGDFFAAGRPTLPGTRILQLTGDVRTEIFGTEIVRTEEEGEDGMLRITETEVGQPAEITHIVGTRVEAVTGLELAQYEEPEDKVGFYRDEPLFVPPPHIKKTRGDLAKVSIRKTA